MDTTFIIMILFAFLFWIIFGLRRKPSRKDNQKPISDDQIRISIRYEDDPLPPLEKPKTAKFSPQGLSLEPIELDFSLGELPQVKTTAPGGPYGMEKDKYQLDLEQAQCSCKSWENRQQFPLGDPRRLCHHLVYAYRKRNLIQGNDKWAEAIIENEQGVPLKSWLARLQSAPDALVTKGSSDEWLNVFAHEKKSGERIAEASGPIRRYGWSMIEKRWSYGVSVAGARELNKILREATHD